MGECNDSSHSSLTSAIIEQKISSFDTVCQAVLELLGTIVPGDAPLMGAGLDSLGATALISSVCDQTGLEIEPTALFDHPTIDGLSGFLSSRAN